MKIESISVSTKKGTRKVQVVSANLVVNHGVEGDAHAGSWHRQVSFLSSENIEKTRNVRLGETAVVEITQIGKECHKKCAIYYQAGDCIMPKEGVFGRVLEGGEVRCGDAVSLFLDSDPLEEKC
ncbi:MAG: MOSC domain-containing protein [Deltaproteobacteria bacterium]|nr:MOSC domain-containing protein [Deltaproteobacteria bacterium]